MAIIKLKSKDGKMFEVEEKVARMSGTINTMLDDLGVTEDDTEPIPLNNVPGHILKLVLKWAEQHKDDPAPDADENDDERRAREVPQWDQDFLKVDDSALFGLITAANFMDMKGLLFLACKTIANMISGKKPGEVRKRFDIKDDIPDDEKKKLKKESKWCSRK